MVCSREVAAFSSPPSPSKISAISCALYVREPLKSRCSRKWETPAFASVSSREPAPIQKPSATERTLGTRSEMTRSPESSSDRTYFCTAGGLSCARLGELPLPDDLAARCAARPRLGRDLRVRAVAGVVARRRARGEAPRGRRERRRLGVRLHLAERPAVPGSLQGRDGRGG